MLAAGCLAAHLLSAQTPKPDPDTIELTDGEKLIGQLEQSNGSSVKFKSDVLGELTIDWSKIKELHTARKFAVLPKKIDLRKNADVSNIPQGTIAETDQKITVTPPPGPAQTVAVADADHLIEDTAFLNAVHHNPRFFSDWGGSVTAGASLVEATQQSRTFTGAIDLLRTVPGEDWLRRRNRTLVDFTFSYGTLEQPATPVQAAESVRSNIYHGDIERDEYLSDTIFVFGQASFDHNFAQGLNLQQTYAGGLGWSLIKRANETLDLKAGITYVRQEFQTASADQDLAGSTFEEDFTRGFRRGIKFTEQLIVAPAWTNSNALTASANATLALPVYKRTNFTLGTIDNYLHDPPPFFKKNSFQMTMGLNYSLR